MPLIFRDTFTETIGSPALSSHTPDTGDSWTQLINIGDTTLGVASATDRCTKTAGGGGLGDGAAWTADATYSSADYEVAYTVAVLESGDDPFWLLARVQDSNNFYAAHFNRDEHRIYKKVGGTWTALTSLTSFNTSLLSVVQDRFSLIVEGTTIDLRLNGTLIATATDSAISAAGKAGVGIGNIGADSGHDTDTQAFDTFSVHTLTTGSPTTETLRPALAGLNQQLARSDGGTAAATNYTFVDETVADEDTTYVRSPAGGFTGRQDFYNHGGTATTALDTVLKVQVYNRIARGAAWASPDAGSPLIYFPGSGGTETARGQAIIPAATTYEDVEQRFYHNPATGNILTSTALATMQIGAFHRSGNLGLDDVRTTQVWAVVTYVAAGGGGGGGLIVSDPVGAGVIPFLR